jgi:NADH-quinone oxidoreductase subunit N
MFIGNSLAIGVTKIKRFLGYTSISQFGFLLVCIASNSIELIVFSLIYLFLYNLLLLPIILIFIEVSPFMGMSAATNFSDIGFFTKNNLFLKIITSFSLLSISGLPPLILFIYKYIIFLNLLINYYSLFVLAIIILNVISITYYLRVLSYV